MRLQLNLASRPFIELGPLYLRLRVLIVLLAVVAVPLWLLLATEKEKAAEAQARLDAVQQKIMRSRRSGRHFNRRCGNRRMPRYYHNRSFLTRSLPAKPSPGPQS